MLLPVTVPLYEASIDDDVSGECDPVVSLIRLTLFAKLFPLIRLDPTALPFPEDCCWEWGWTVFPPEQGFPSFTNTGTATRLGELADWKTFKVKYL